MPTVPTITMMPTVLMMLTIVCVLVVVDAIWLYIVHNSYNNMIRSIQGSALSPNLLSAIVVYLLIALGIYYFVISDTSHRSKIWSAFLLGIISYGIYFLNIYDYSVRSNNFF